MRHRPGSSRPAWKRRRGCPRSPGIAAVSVVTEPVEYLPGTQVERAEHVPDSSRAAVARTASPDGPWEPAATGRGCRLSGPNSSAQITRLSAADRRRGPGCRHATTWSRTRVRYQAPRAHHPARIPRRRPAHVHLTLTSEFDNVSRSSLPRNDAPFGWRSSVGRLHDQKSRRSLPDGDHV